MKKWFVIIFILIFGLTIQLAFQPELQRFSHGVNKYTTKNIPQNSGWKKTIMQGMQLLNGLYPNLSEVPESAITSIFDNFQSKELKVDFKESILVSNIDELRAALAVIKPGMAIVLSPGIYEIEGKALRLKAQNEFREQILIKSLIPKESILQIYGQVGLKIETGNWTIDGLVFKGACKIARGCQHAIHVVGDSDDITIINNDFNNFNAAIKSNGIPIKGTGLNAYPDRVLIAYNRFYNDSLRDTKSPVTPIDVVGGNDWKIKNNFIADFAKQGGNRITYGAFLKGGGENGEIVGNVVACKWKVPYFSVFDARVGLSFGGGGTGQSYCQSKKCAYEHKNGLLANNVILNCFNEVAIYINSSDDVRVWSNYLVNTLGIDIANNSQGISFFANSLHGNIDLRDTSELAENTKNKRYFSFQSILEHKDND